MAIKLDILRNRKNTDNDKRNPAIEITQTGNLNIKFVGCTSALTRAWLDDLRIK